MNRSVLSSIVLASSLLAGCPGPEGKVALSPFRDDWDEVARAEFPYYDDEGMVQIRTINIGGTEYTDNFVNRGDVIVKYDNPAATQGSPGEITVEIRRFSWSEDENDAEEAWDKIQPWISADGPGNPAQPDDLDPTLDCTEVWMDGCGVRIWYEGQIQPALVGADIRVHLPSNYAYQLNITTQDNDNKDTYQNRGNVCVESLRGNAEIQVKSGRVYVALPPDMVPAPTCTPEQIEACENYVDDEGNNAAWDVNCGCDTLGKLGVQGTAAAEIEVDIPATLWGVINGRNEDEADNAEDCVADVANLAGAVDFMPSERPYQQSRELNKPSDAAPTGSGYAFLLQSASCAPVFFTEDPEDYVGEDGAVDDQMSELRGNIRGCNGCLQGMSCEDLLPGTY